MNDLRDFPTFERLGNQYRAGNVLQTVLNVANRIGFLKANSSLSLKLITYTISRELLSALNK